MASRGFNKLLRTAAVTATVRTMSSASDTSTKGRSVSRIVAPKEHRMSGATLYRCIGTLDIDGNGTEHSLDQVDPFMLLDYAVVTKNDMPPFGAHPHRGHSVVTVLLHGRYKSWDSFSDPLGSTIETSGTFIDGPSSYWVDAGSGVFHDERSVIADESDVQQHCKLLQLWMTVKDEDRYKPAKAQYSTESPVEHAVSANDNSEVVAAIRYYVGDGVGIETMHSVTVAHVVQKPNTTLHFPVDPAHGGFILTLNGRDAPARYGSSGHGMMMPNNNVDVFVLADTTDQDEDFIAIQTAGGTGIPDTEYVICTGLKHDQAWYKKLSANGAIVAATPEQAREIGKEAAAASARGLKKGGSFAPYGRNI